VEPPSSEVTHTYDYTLQQEIIRFLYYSKDMLNEPSGDYSFETNYFVVVAT
jgi:hypothetical protein